MNIAAYVELVASMRAAQRTYFRDRTQEALEKSKELERKVDEETSYLRKQLANEPTQREML